MLRGGSVDPATLLRTVFRGTRCESDRHIRIASKKIAPWRSIANMRSQEALLAIETGPALGRAQELSQFESPPDLSVLPLLFALIIEALGVAKRTIPGGFFLSLCSGATTFAPPSVVMSALTGCHGTTS